RIANLRESRTSFDSLTHAPDEEVIHVYMDGNMAVYTARLKIEGRYGSHPEHGEFRALDAWIRRDGRLPKLASQLTPIHKQGDPTWEELFCKPRLKPSRQGMSVRSRGA